MVDGEAEVVIDAGPHGWGNAGHGHADALSLQLMSRGRAPLSDPGTCCYPQEKPERDLFRSTGAHNTLEVDGLSQAEPQGPFAWANHPRTTVEHWHTGELADVFAGSHDGYRRLSQPVLHRRWIVLWKGSGWLVRDVASGTGLHGLAVSWHSAPGLMMRIVPAEGQDWVERTEEGVWSAAYGDCSRARVFRLRREGTLPAECACVLATTDIDVRFRRIMRDERVSVYEWRDHAGVRLIFFAEPGGIWEAEGFRSDAALLVAALDENRRAAALAACDVTRVEAEGRAIVRRTETAAFYEWRA